MISNGMKLHSARRWHIRLGHLNQADGVRNAPEKVGELDDIFNLCTLAKITKTPVPRVVENQAEEKLERVLTDVMDPFRVESLSHCQVSSSALYLQTITQSLCWWTCLRKRVKNWPA